MASCSREDGTYKVHAMHIIICEVDPMQSQAACKGGSNTCFFPPGHKCTYILHIGARELLIITQSLEVLEKPTTLVRGLMQQGGIVHKWTSRLANRTVETYVPQTGIRGRLGRTLFR
jgi:hypothetical protein